MKCALFHKKSNFCSDNPALGLGLVRMGVVALFLVSGILKVLDPEMLKGFLDRMLHVPEAYIECVYWLVVVTEIAGAVLVFLGKLIPRAIYLIALLGLAVVIGVATYFVHWGDLMAVLSHVLIFLNLIALAVTRPMCPSGCPIGDKK